MAVVGAVSEVVPNPAFSSVWTTEIAEALGALVMGLLISGLLLWLAYYVLRSLGVVDVPNSRSSHTVPTIRGMGIGVILAWGITVGFVSQPPLGFLAGVAMIVLLGAIDDFRPLPSSIRFLSQIVLSGIVAASLIDVLRPELPYVVTLLVLVLFLTATINSVNFMDGINGLSATHAALWGVTYTLILVAFVRPDSPWTVITATLAGAFVAFLPWNARRRARGFLGDSGSYGLGAIVGSLAIVTWAVTGSWIAALLPLGIYGLDTLLTAIRRSVSGKSLLEAHRDHVYQRNMARSGSVLAAGFVALACTAILCVLAVLFAYARVNLWLVIVLGVLTATVYSMSPYLFAPLGRNEDQTAAGMR